MSRRQEVVRRADHAGSWYSDSRSRLSSQLNNWLSRVDCDHFQPARAIISPHAGYEYSGSCAAFAFKQIDVDKVKRFFILGPSHHEPLRSCALSQATRFETPLGNLFVDQDINQKLNDTQQFQWLRVREDEAEHSIEMQCPYLLQIMQGRQFTIVPVVVPSLKENEEKNYGQIFAPYLMDSENCFVISSDFCHWGSRFNYRYYRPEWGPIYKSIERLDKQGMQAIKELSPSNFRSYLREYQNTICGRHPISVLLQAIEAIESQHPEFVHTLKFLNYKQSDSVTNDFGSSVSYAAASLLQFSNAQPQNIARGTQMIDVASQF